MSPDSPSSATQEPFPADQNVSTEVDEFLADILPKQRAAEQAMHHGDAEPRLALWSHQDPVTLYGAKLIGSGWADLEPKFREVASWFADSVAYEFEVVAAGASGDLAYTIGYEHNHVTVDGKPTTYTLRVTHVYRREDGQWRIVHRHADVPPTSDSIATILAAEGRHGESGSETSAT